MYKCLLIQQHPHVAHPGTVFAGGEKNQVARLCIFLFQFFAKLSLLGGISRQLYLRHIQVNAQYQTGTVSSFPLFRTSVLVRGTYPCHRLLDQTGLLLVEMMPFDICAGINVRTVTANTLAGRTPGQEHQHHAA